MLCLYHYGSCGIIRLHIQCCATLHLVTQSHHHFITHISESLPCLQRTPPVFSNASASTSRLGYWTKMLCTTPSLLQNTNPLTTKQKILLAKAEYELYKEEGEDMPSQVTDQSWEQLATMSSQMKRAKYFRYLFLTENKRESEKIKQINRREYSLERFAKISEELNSDYAHMSYGLWRNTIFTRFDHQRMNKVNNHRLMNAKMYGQHIVFDNSFDACMSMQEKTNLAKQFAQCFGINRMNADPFYIHLCNFNTNDETSKKISLALPKMLNNIFPLDVHKENYLDIFPKKQLVYLTPHCSQELIEYDHEAVYIIGNIVDKGDNVPVTLTKAKRENIKTAKLPLDRYLDWGQGSKSLALHRVLRIMLAVKSTDNWQKALYSYVPEYKLVKLQNVSADEIKRRMSVRSSRERLRRMVEQSRNS